MKDVPAAERKLLEGAPVAEQRKNPNTEDILVPKVK